MIPHRWFLAVAGILIAGSLAQPVAADEYDVFGLGAGASLTHDSNLFRRPDSLNPQSDIISRGYVGLRIDKPYKQQRFQLNVTETASWYREFSYLNFDALSYRAAWLWHLTPRVSGTLSADRSESLAPFEETAGIQRNVRTIENRVFDLDGWLFGGWHVIAGISQSEQKSEQPFQSEPDFRSVSLRAGIKYLFPSGSAVAFTQRSIRGNYLDTAFDPTNSNYDAYRQYESELDASWILSERSTVTGRLAWVERHNENFTQGDFSGPAGRLGFHWSATDKLRVDLSVRRDIRPYVDFISGSTYQLENVLSLAPTWQATDKISVRMVLERAHSYYRGGVAAPGAPSRSDSRRSEVLAADWALLRSVSVGASLQRQRRTSDDPLFNYDATIASISASLKF